MLFISDKVIISKYFAHHETLYFWETFLKFLKVPNKVQLIIPQTYIDHKEKQTFNLAQKQKFYLYFNTYVLEIQVKENNLIILSKYLTPETEFDLFSQPTDQFLCNSLHCGTVIYFQINIEFPPPKLLRARNMVMCMTVLRR